MTLSPFEAERREFGRGAFGYRRRDVDHFVDEVQRSLRELWQDRSDARDEVDRLKERLASFEQLEDQLKNTLLLAQDSAEKAHEQAKRESELVMREAGLKSRDIVHAAHEEKQKLEMVLRDLHSAEQEARQRLRAMSTAILSHLDDTEALVSENTGTFRAIVQAHPDASERRVTDAVTAATDRTSSRADTAETPSVHADDVARAADRIAAHEASAARVAAGTAAPAPASEVAPVSTGVAATPTADAFFDAPPTFDAGAMAAREE